MERRAFIRAARAAGLATCGGLGRAAAPLPLLELLELTPRERLIAELAARIRGGLREEELLAALAEAAARNVQPVPHVGFIYHTLMVLRSGAEAVRHLPPAEHWLPLLWAADYFKSAQAEEHTTSGWHQAQRPVSAAGAATAARDLTTALDRWDVEAADAALVNGLHATPSDTLFTTLFWYGARDLRDLGHKAINVANAHRLVMGLSAPQAQSVLRSTASALLTAGGDPDPATHDLEPDRSFRQNVQRLETLPPAWKQGRDDGGGRTELRKALYTSSPVDAGSASAELLRRGISPEALWRVLFDVAAELILIRPSVVTLHAQTSANALYYAYRQCPDQRTQQLALLQGTAFVAMFRATTRATERDCDLAALESLPVAANDAAAIDELSADIAADRRLEATRKTLGYLQRGGDAARLMAWVRHNVAWYADDPHDFKYAEAVFENHANVADTDWRQRCLSAGMGLYKAPEKRPGRVVAQALELLRA